MRIELLCKIADIINAGTKDYNAVIPMGKQDYVEYCNKRIEHSSCYVLRINSTRKRRKKSEKTVWVIYEKDLDSLIALRCRHDQDFAERIAACEPTRRDVEQLIRRASFKYLRLNIDDSLYMYLSDTK